jgi:Flp pilus assembly protein TadD
MAETHNLLGQTVAQQGKHEEAVAAFRRAIQLNPRYVAAHLQLGTTLAQLNRLEDALAELRTAARLDPRNGEVPFRIANCLRQAGRQEEAVAAYFESIRIEPGVVESWLNLGVTLAGLERFEEAEAAYRDGLRYRPGNVALINNLGVALKNQLRFEEGLACFAEVLRLEPEHVEAHRNRALTWLLLGDMEQGWPEHEWRLRRADQPGLRLSQPYWDGSPLAGRTILLYPEQGIGDTVQFVRYAALLKEQGARVLMLCPTSLMSLLGGCDGIDQIIPPDSPLPSFDVHASLMSLPFLIGKTQKSIPTAVPYLTAAGELMTRWKSVFDGVTAFKVGIAWQGNPAYPADRGRSIPLACFAPLAQLPGVQLVSVQKGPGVEQLARIEEPILSFDRQADESAGAFMDTAAILRGLDLVITSDTAVAHLAGALGVPAWVLLPLVPDWRWQLEREDSAWYPTMRLFRQCRRGDWADVFHRVAAALSDEVAKRGRRRDLLVPVSAGELIDKITILEIKAARIVDAGQLKNVSRELDLLREAHGRTCPPSEELSRLTAELRAVNEKLWDIEDAIRQREAAEDFGAQFIKLARSVYRENDRRGRVKRLINELLGSKLIEEKSYADWQTSKER